MSEGMTGYEAAVKAKEQDCVVQMGPKGKKAHWKAGGFRWAERPGLDNPVGVNQLIQTSWRVVEESDEPEPPEGCVLLEVAEHPEDVQLQVDTGKGVQPLCTIEADPRFRGWGYVLDGELTISAVAIAYTDGDRLVGNKNAFQDDVIRPDYAVMEKEARDDS